jgi:membrane associated rhomboid family serine protease
MLEDRDYMRQPEFGEQRWRPAFRWRWSWTMILLVAYLIVFLAELAVGRFFPGKNFFGYLALSRTGIEHGFAWQLVTYQFLHAGWLHLLLNCWAIYIFGTELEHLLGGRRYLALVFSSGIVGGILQVLTAIVWPQLFDGAIVGASACAFGLVAAFAFIFPERELTLLLFFVIPVRLRAKTLLILCAVIALMGIIFPWDNVANAAHLGGMATGWFYARQIYSRNWQPRLLKKANSPADSWKNRAPENTATEFVANEVDPILDKISAHGIQSLTARERAVLEAARKKMAQR